MGQNPYNMSTIKIKTITEVEVTHLQVDAGVRYWEDTEINGAEDNDDDPKMPFIKDGRWKPVIDLASGKIIDWPQGMTAKVHYKVCDDGIYTLVDAAGEEVKQIDGYVPEILNAEDGGFGDYIIMNIDADGVIGNWDARNLTEFEQEDED